MNRTPLPRTELSTNCNLRKSPVADDAFPSHLASLPKQRKSIISHRASLYCDVNSLLHGNASNLNSLQPIFLQILHKNTFQRTKVTFQLCALQHICTPSFCTEAKTGKGRLRHNPKTAAMNFFFHITYPLLTALFLPHRHKGPSAHD